MTIKRALLSITFLIIGSGLIGCQSGRTQQSDRREKTDPLQTMNRIAESYVKLVLAVGQHDSNYVDAYYGPEAWQTEAKEKKRPLDDIEKEAAPLATELEKLDLSGQEEI